jgi:hypothetical protein
LTAKGCDKAQKIIASEQQYGRQITAATRTSIMSDAPDLRIHAPDLTIPGRGEIDVDYMMDQQAFNPGMGPQLSPLPWTYIGAKVLNMAAVALDIYPNRPMPAPPFVDWGETNLILQMSIVPHANFEYFLGPAMQADGACE